MSERHGSDANHATAIVLMALGWVVFAAAGCGGNLGAQSGEPDTEPWGCGECQGTDQRPDDDSSESPTPASPCTPRAAAAGNIEEPPELPERVRRLQCQREQKEGDREAGESTESVRWTRTESGYRKSEHGPDGEVEREIRFELDDGSIVRIERKRVGVEYGKGRATTVWSFDNQGRLVTYHQKAWDDSAKDDLERSRKIRQTWSEGRLVAREVHSKRAEQEEANVTTIRWNYDGSGRLVEARRRTENGTTQRVEWSYEKGRPASVTRYVDGIPAFAQSWSYREDGGLKSRSVQYGRRGLEGNLDENLPVTPPLDDLAVSYPGRPQNIYSVIRLPSQNWRALPQQDSARNCYELPNSVAHGYPTERRAYRMIWDRTKTAEIAAAPESSFAHLEPLYASRAFGTARPDRSWYGHGGVLGGRPGGPPGRQGANITSRAVDGQIEYGPDGRMVSETVRRENSDGSTTEFRRTREFGSAGLTSDKLVVETSKGDADPKVHRRTLRFERGSEGRIQRRELLIDGVRVDYQDFEYDAAGRWVGLDAFNRGLSHGPRQALADLSRAIDTDALAESTRTARYRRSFDDDGRLTMQHSDAGNGYAFTGYRKRITWGPHGPVEIVVDNPDRDERAPELRRIRYDERGRKVRLEVRQNGETKRVERWRWRDDGNLASHVGREPSSGSVEATRYRYTCAGDGVEK